MPRDSFRANGPNQGAADWDFDPRKLLRRRSSLVVADLPTREHIKNVLARDDGPVAEEGSDEEGDDDGGDGEESGEEEDEDEEESEEEEPVKPAPKKPPPTQFHEPDANSLLDAFGF
ncbi:hypothetical protein OPT61_g2840 [Boeremia exigua]|uniref:Uncharacterized protein n=1 Tax=Boeremia exigua TaxID=749465 RepID=A0ACC2IK55_9PLEO|nr:hypothetical protein OPT61_g2840 [Boeremia exigua]